MRKFLLNPDDSDISNSYSDFSNDFPSFRLLCDGFRVSWPERVKNWLSSWIPEKTSKLLVSPECCAGHTKHLRGPNVSRGPRVRHPWFSLMRVIHGHRTCEIILLQNIRGMVRWRMKFEWNCNKTSPSHWKRGNRKYWIFLEVSWVVYHVKARSFTPF